MIPNLVPRDPVSIGLSRALDLKTLGSEFARALPDAVTIRQVTIDRLKYVPGEKAVLGVRVEREGYTTPLRYGVRIFAQDAVPDRFEKARSQRGLVAPECGDPVIHLPSLNAVAWAFPNDRKIAGSSNLLSSDCWPVTGPDLTMEILRYVPEQSCTIRLQSVTAATLFGKTTQACASGRVMGVLSALSQNAAGGVGFARHVPSPRAGDFVWQECVPGASVQAMDLLSQPEELARIARAIAGFHQTPCDGLDVRRPEHLLRSAPRLRNLLAMLPPGSQTAALACASWLEDGPPLNSSAPVLTSHGDLHPKNIFDDGQTVSLIDVDSVALAQPELDLGSFSAALIYFGVLNGLNTQAIEQALTVLRATWCDATGRALDAGLLNWSIATCLIFERVYRCLSRLKPGRVEICSHLVAWASKVMRTESELGAHA